jgi:hypothetical protein
MSLYEILLALFACGFALIVIELGLTVFHPVPHSIEFNMFFEADPYTGYRLKPNGVGYYERGIPAVANSHGHRDVETTLEKPAGVFRILVLGDSFTVGANVRQEEAWPKVLEKHLRSIYGSRIEVINSAVGGWDPFQYAQYFEHYGCQFEPDLILVGFFVGNDTFDPHTDAAQLNTAMLGHRISRDAASQPLTKFKVFLHDHSNLARLLLTRTPASRTYVRKESDDFTDVYLAIQRSRLPNHLRCNPEQRAKAQNSVNQIRRIKDRAGESVPLAVVLLPDENQVNPSLRNLLLDANEIGLYDFNMPQSMLIEMFREIGIPTIDVLRVVRANHRDLYMNDTHWIPEGHELAASAILDRLVPMLAELGVKLMPPT